MRTPRFFTILLFLAILFAGKSLSLVHHANGEENMTFTIASPAFTANGEIPTLYTGEGKDLSPPLSWSGLPDKTQSLALIVDDPDAPDPAAPKMTYVHWVLFDMPTTAPGLEEGVKTLPEGTQNGLNDWKRPGYGGPMPPIGQHRYFFKLYALDTKLNLSGTPTKDELEHAMQNHILSKATIMGTYRLKHK